MTFQNIKINSKLSIRLLAAIVICSTILTLFSSIVQLLFDYKKSLNMIHENMHFIEKSYLPSITSSVYILDERQIESLLNGCLNFPDIEYLEITDTSNELYKSAGNKSLSQDFTKIFPLEYKTPSGKIIPVGTLILSASVKGLYDKLWEKAYIILLTDLVKTFFAAILIFLIIHYMVIRHLITISRFTRNINLDKLCQKLILNRRILKTDATDELDQLVQSINLMIGNIKGDADRIKKIQISLLESEKLFRSTFENAAIGMCLTNIDGYLKMVNPMMCKIFGYQEEKLVGKRFTELTHPEDVELSIQKVKHVLDGKAQNSLFEKRYINSSGDTVWASVGTFLIRNDENKPEYFVTYIENITDRKKAEETKNKILESSIGGIYIYDLSLGKNIYINKQFITLTGYTLDEISLMTGNDFLSLVHPEDLSQVLEHMRSVTEELADGHNLHLDYRFKYAKGGWKWFRSCDAVYERDESGKARQFIGTFIDITKRKNLEERLQQAQKMESIGTLAGGIAHDFNNILYPIIGFAEMLKEDLPPDGSAHESAQEIFNAGKRGG